MMTIGTSSHAAADDRLQGVTLWRRIADEIEQAIVAGTYATGDRLPGEIEIADRFHVNRHTVRRALADLAQRGLVRAERGSGTFVAPGGSPILSACARAFPRSSAPPDARSAAG